MAPERTINDAAFWFTDESGATQYARRGETVFIPEGEDLVRGDKFGAFAKVTGAEVPATPNTTIPDIEADWSGVEFDRYVDTGTANEILAKLDEVSPELRSTVAVKLADAEGRRKGGGRKTLLEALAKVAGPKGAGEPAPVVDEPTPDLASQPVPQTAKAPKAAQ